MGSIRFVERPVAAPAPPPGSPDFGRVFYDDFEYAGTPPFAMPTTKWLDDGGEPMPQIVDTSSDGVLGPYAGSKMARCNWSTGFTGARKNDYAYTDELFIRVRYRIDENLEKTNTSPTKILRFYHAPPGNDMYTVIYTGTRVRNEAVAGGGTALDTIEAGASTGSTSVWHLAEFYFKLSTGLIKVWYDSVICRNETVAVGGGWEQFYLISNWSDSHDATNYVYFDEFEIFSDDGTGGTGSMADATCAA